MIGSESTVRGWQRRKWIFSLFTRSSVGGSLTFQVALVAGEAGGLFSASLEFQFRDRRTWSRDIASAKSTSNQSWGIICTKKNVISSQNTLNRVEQFVWTQINEHVCSWPWKGAGLVGFAQRMFCFIKNMIVIKKLKNCSSFCRMRLLSITHVTVYLDRRALKSKL